MKTNINLQIVFIAIIVLCSTAIGQDGFYYYAFGKKIDMIINREYIAVTVDESNFSGWDNIYNNESALNSSTLPEYLADNIYRLKVANAAETDNLISSLADYGGVIKVNYCFIMEGGSAPFPNMLLGDANCDGSVNLLDIVYLIEYYNQSGPRPPLCYKY